MNAPSLQLPIDTVLATAPDAAALDLEIGRSRGGRPLFAGRWGHGPLHLSLIAGCHADEPVGPETLRRLATWLAGLPASAPELGAATWFLVPHVNPDGEAANCGWSGVTVPTTDYRGNGDRGYDLPAYLDCVVREAPGDDLEWGFPLDADDRDTRPENLAVADFLRAGAPFGLLASFLSMAFARGPWFLLEPAWIERSAALRLYLGRRVAAMGYSLHDVDRGGEKGFRRIDTGFSTRPDARAMASWFIERGDAEMASRFHLSSMEFVRELGGDPLTLVSEMPLFLMPQEIEGVDAPPLPTGTEGRLAFFAWAARRRSALTPGQFRAAAEAFGIRPMPLADQMRLQLEFLNAGLAAVETG